MTAKQKAHARQERAVLALRRSAVRYSVLGDAQDEPGARDAFALAFADLCAACDRYADTLTARERRKLGKP